VLGNFGIDKQFSQSFQLSQSPFFIGTHQAARPDDIRRQNSCQSSL
jgi:hypothetical protein